MASDFSVGVEEEYQLVDPGTGELRSRAREVLAGDWSAELRAELQETTLEIGTVVCDSVPALDRDLRRLRFQVATAAAAEGLEIVAAGTHPFSRWEGQEVTRGDRYDQIVSRFGRVARDEHNFGMHIHVAVPAGLDRIAILNVVRAYTPHLLALSCSSPYYEGEDSGYSSYRMILWRRWPTTGVPPRLESWAEYRRFVDLLLRTGMLSDERNLYWAVRPHAIYPTLEYRVTDVCPRVDDAVAIAALARAITMAAAEGILRERRCDGFSEASEHALLAANDWSAARFGLDASLVDPRSRTGKVPLRASLMRLVERVAPMAEAVGDGEALAGVEALLRRGTGAERMRRVADTGEGYLGLIDWLRAETLLGTGLDRRRSQRDMCA